MIPEESTSISGDGDTKTSFSLDELSREELVAQIELLTEENDRLRRKDRQTRQSEYRRTAVGLLGCGIAAAIAGIIFPASRSVLFALAGTGIFGAVLLYYLTPERFVAASVGEHLYSAIAAQGTTLQSELGLADIAVYLPIEGSRDDNFVSVLLFVPQHTHYALPDVTTLDTGFVITDSDRQRGVAIYPTGAALYQDFQSRNQIIAESAEDLAEVLGDAIVESFELADRVIVERNSDGNGVTVGISGSTLGSIDRFDHPVASFFATGLAHVLDCPVTVDQRTPEEGDDQVDHLVHCSWDSAETNEFQQT